MKNTEILEHLFMLLDINKGVKLAAVTESQIAEVERIEKKIEDQIKNTYVK